MYILFTEINLIESDSFWPPLLSWVSGQVKSLMFLTQQYTSAWIRFVSLLHFFRQLLTLM